MVSTEALIANLVIGKHEGRDVVTTDAAGDYWSANMDNFVVTKIEGMIEFMVKADPIKYSKHIRTHNNTKYYMWR